MFDGWGLTVKKNSVCYFSTLWLSRKKAKQPAIASEYVWPLLLPHAGIS